MPRVWSFKLGWYKMWIIYVKFWVDTLVLIRVSLTAANCAWPWLNIISKKGAYQGSSSPSGQALFNWCLYWGDATDLTWLDNWLLSEGIWFSSIFRNLFGEHMLIYVRMSILLINFAWFWSKCCFQIPGPGVRWPLLYNKCRTCTILY